MAIPNLILFLVSAGILFYVLRFRVHIHILYQRRTKPTENHPSPANGKRPGRLEAAPEVVSDLASALKNLGCPAAKGRKIAERVYQQAPQARFEILLREAIREAA
jgi:Holliday junction resolvasome RuvABC DNA-binding subunit